MQIYNYVGVGTPSPYTVQGSTISINTGHFNIYNYNVQNVKV